MDRVAAAIEAAKQAVADLRANLAAAVPEIGADINAKIDEVQARIEEIQAAVDERQGQ